MKWSFPFPPLPSTPSGPAPPPPLFPAVHSTYCAGFTRLQQHGNMGTGYHSVLNGIEPHLTEESWHCRFRLNNARPSERLNLNLAVHAHPLMNVVSTLGLLAHSLTRCLTHSA